MSDTQDDVRITAKASDRADALMDLGRYEQAIPLLSKSLAETPDDDRLHCRLADAFYSLGDHEKSQDYAERALHLNPNSDHAHFRLAWLNLKNNYFDTALQHAKAAISIDSDDATNLYTLAWAEYHSGNNNKALSAAKRAIELNPDNADLHELIADLLFSTGEAKQAEPHYREALRYDPQSASIHCNLGQCLAIQHKVHEAAEHILTAVKIEPNNDHYRNTLFNIIRHDLTDMPMQSQRKALAQLDPAVQYFYQDQLDRRSWFEKLRTTSIVTLWLLVLMTLMLIFSWVTGEDLRKLYLSVIMIAGVYLVLIFMRVGLNIIRNRHNNNR